MFVLHLFFNHKLTGMKKLFLTLSTFVLTTACFCQKKKYITAAVFNTQTAMPFSKFKGLFKEALHPGIEIGLGKNFLVKQKGELFAEARVGFFYHRFVQAALPLTVAAGYRYKAGPKLFFLTSLGGGYMHSIPATAKFRLTEDGTYKNNKGIGRMQATVSFDAGAGYTLSKNASRPFSIFIKYQQRVQLPFVKSYVPVLPYNSFMVGVSQPF